MSQDQRENEALISYLRGVINSKDQQISLLEAEIVHQKAVQGAIESTGTSVENSTIILLKNELQTTQNDLTEARENIKLLMLNNSENKILKEEIQKLQHRIESMESEHHTELAEAHEEVSQARSVLANEFQAQLEIAIRNKTRMAISALPQRAVEAMTTNDSLKQKILALEEDLSELMAENKKLKATSEDKKIWAGSLQEEMSTLIRSKQVVVRKLDESKLQLQQIKKENSSIKALQEALTVVKLKLNATEEELKKIETEKKALIFENKKLKAALSSACERLGVHMDIFYRPSPSQLQIGAGITGQSSNNNNANSNSSNLQHQQKLINQMNAATISLNNANGIDAETLHMLDSKLRDLTSAQSANASNNNNGNISGVGRFIMPSLY